MRYFHKNIRQALFSLAKLAAFLTLAIAGEVASAVPFALFDINDAALTSTPPTQVGYLGLGGDSHNTSATSGGVTLVLSQTSNVRARDRGTGGNVASSSLPDIYRDFTHADSDIGTQAKVHLTGLTPGQSYDIRWYHYENAAAVSHNARVYENGVAANNLIFTKTGFGSNTDPDVTGFTDFTVAAKSDGTIDLITGSHLPGANTSGVGDRSITYMNGLEISLSAAPPAALDKSIARWDVNDEGATPNQSGFVPLNGNLANQTVASGMISLTMTQDTGRDRDGVGTLAANSSLPDLYRDFTHSDTSTSGPLSVLLEDLNPNLEYRMRWYHYESRNAGGSSITTVYQDSVLAANLLFTTNVSGTVADPDAAGFTDFYVTPNANGEVLLITGLAPTGARSISYFNGLEIFAPVPTPEPSTAILALFGLVGCVVCRRQRRVV